MKTNSEYTIKQALQLASQQIYPSRQGNQWVISRPFYGLSRANGPRLAPGSSYDWGTIQRNVREARIQETVELLTGDAEYAYQVGYLDDDWPCPDWREVVRKAVREYKPNND